MKLPFPALLILRNGSPRLGLSVYPVTVTMLFPSSQQAMVEIQTPSSRHVVNKMVSFDHLASTREIAAAKVAQAVAAVIETLPASEAKAAATAEVAGVGSAAGTSFPPNL